MTNNKMFDCQQMFRHACAFADCADMAEAKFRSDTADIEWYTTPAIVNSAFACEVYLKALLLFHDIKNKREHALKNLYDMLPDRIKDFIVPTVLKACGTWTDPFGFEQIDLISNAFKEWRYYYEDLGSTRTAISINRSFLKAFRNALREACCEQFFSKTWEEYQR